MCVHIPASLVHTYSQCKISIRELTHIFWVEHCHCEHFLNFTFTFKERVLYNLLPVELQRVDFSVAVPYSALNQCCGIMDENGKVQSLCMIIIVKYIWLQGSEFSEFSENSHPENECQHENLVVCVLVLLLLCVYVVKGDCFKVSILTKKLKLP